MVHHTGRPDLFRADAKKYTDGQLLEIFADDKRPIFVGVDENNNVLGYAFCVYEEYENDNILTDRKTLYIDDICVDENTRGQKSENKYMKMCVILQKIMGFIM